MAMSKKDYVLITDAFAHHKGKVMTSREKSLIIRLATGIANRLRAGNPAFDTNKFMEACCLPEDVNHNC